MAEAKRALAKLIAQDALTLLDQISLALLNPYSTVKWYEPVVTFLPRPRIDPDIADVFNSVLRKV